MKKIIGVLVLGLAIGSVGVFAADKKTYDQGYKDSACNVADAARKEPDANTQRFGTTVWNLNDCD
jgi:hypothetical protein